MKKFILRYRGAGAAALLLFGIALQTILAQHINVAAGTHVRLSSGTVLKLDTLHIQNGGTGVLRPASEVRIAAALVNAGTLSCDTSSTVHFTGGSQFLCGGALFANLSKSGGGILTLNGHATVNGTLLLDSGLIALGLHDLTVGPSGSISGASAANHIITDSAGALRRMAGASDVLFPIGPTGASYNPVVIGNAGTPDIFSVNVQTTFDHTPANTNGVVARQWKITEAVLGGSDATITLRWNPEEENDGFVRANPISIARYSGEGWESTPASFSGSAGDHFTAQAGGFDLFSAFAVGNDIALSVEREDGMPKTFALYQNYPNPFNPSTTITFQIPEVGGQRSDVSRVTLKVYDLLGREAATLMNEEMKAGKHSVRFDASRLSTGVYIYTLRTGDFVVSKKLLLMK